MPAANFRHSFHEICRKLWWFCWNGQNKLACGILKMCTAWFISAATPASFLSSNSSPLLWSPSENIFPPRPKNNFERDIINLIYFVVNSNNLCIDPSLRPSVVFSFYMSQCKSWSNFNGAVLSAFCLPGWIRFPRLVWTSQKPWRSYGITVTTWFYVTRTDVISECGKALLCSHDSQWVRRIRLRVLQQN